MERKRKKMKKRKVKEQMLLRLNMAANACHVASGLEQWHQPRQEATMGSSIVPLEL